MNGLSEWRGQNLGTMKSRTRSMPSGTSGRVASTPTRVAFIMEQALGHVTHSRNLTAAALARTDILPTWLPIPFDSRGIAGLVPVLRTNWSVRASWRARRALDHALATTQPIDALVFHTQVTALFSVAHMRRIPSVVSLDATPINYDTVGASYNHQPAGDGWLDRQKFRMNESVFQTAARLVTWSDWARRSLVDDYGVDDSKVRVLAPGAAAAYFSIGARRTTSRTAERVQLLFVGGDFGRKGGPLLLDQMRGPLGDRCELHIVTRDAVEPRPNVYVYRGLGPNSPALLRLFEHADMFVLPSLGECLAVVLMEATAAGLPVITTDVAALGEAVRPGETGLLIPPANGRALGEALMTLVHDPVLRRRMGRGGAELAREKFDANRNNAALLDLTREVARARGAERKAA